MDPFDCLYVFYWIKSKNQTFLNPNMDHKNSLQYILTTTELTWKCK